MKLFYYFFDASLGFNPQDYKDGSGQDVLLQREPFATIKQKFGFERLILLHQVHGIDGYLIDQHNKNMVPFSIQGDFLCTNKPGVALGIITADCAPIFLYDSKNNAIASIHAGWKGAVEGIIEQALQRMQKEYGSKREDMQAVIGPCARACCYEIKADFLAILKSKSWPYEESVVEKQSQLFFDLGHYCKAQLIYLGIEENNIVTDQNMCTICNHQFNSYRRNKTLLRQISLIYTS